MGFHPMTSETQDPLFEGQHSHQERGSGTVEQKGHSTDIKYLSIYKIFKSQFMYTFSNRFLL